MLPKHSGVTTG